jgi:hypothetical protein
MRDYPEWDFWTSAEWLRWAVKHTGPVINDYILFWARTDLFPE